MALYGAIGRVVTGVAIATFEPTSSIKRLFGAPRDEVADYALDQERLRTGLLTRFKSLKQASAVPKLYRMAVSQLTSTPLRDRIVQAVQLDAAYYLPIIADQISSVSVWMHRTPQVLPFINLRGDRAFQIGKLGTDTSVRN